MGVALVLFVIAMAFGLFLACVAAVVFFTVAAWMTQGVEKGRGAYLLVTALFPFLCVAWMGAAYLGHGLVNVLVFDRGVRGSIEFDCPLPNGYALFGDEGKLDVVTLYRPAGWPRWRNGMKGGIPDVRQLQMANGYLLGARGRRLVETPETGDPIIESYFLLRTATGLKLEFATLPELEQAARQAGVQPQLRPVGEVYAAHSHTWFDGVLLWLMGLPVVCGAYGMMRWLRRLRACRA
jgi:hypothetical protein